MKKNMLVALVSLLVLAFAVSLVSAASPVSQPPYGQPITLTDEQKQELVPLYNQMIDTKKQILQKFVANGVITQADADQRIAWMQERMNNGMQNGMMGMGRGHGMMGKGNGNGKGPGNGICPRGQQQAPAVNQ